MDASDSNLRNDQVYLDREGDEIRLGNRLVELTLKAQNGHFRNIRNWETGIEHKRPEEGVWPFGITVGTSEQPQQLRTEIRADAVQEMHYSFSATPAGGKRLQLEYPMLADDVSRQPTGIGVGLTIELELERDYFIIRAEIANGGPLWLTQFCGGRGELLSGDASRECESVWIPCRGGVGYGELDCETLGLPTYGWGWSDYSGERGGIGVCYVNRQGIQWCFDLDKTEAGLSTAWRLFDLRGYWHFESLMNDEQKKLLSQALEPGNTFVTDEWLVIPHAGDWHRTADIYRKHFYSAFEGDCLTWEKLPQKARELDVYVGFWVAENEIGNSYPRKVYNHLDRVAPQLQELLQQVEVDAARVGVGLTWFHSQVGRYPDFFPICEAAGGESAWSAMIADLRRMEVGFIGGYTHLSYQHPAARNYIPEADVQGTIPWINPTVGNRACVDNSAWAALWRDELIPAYRGHGLDMVFMDEGHFPWGTCSASGAAHLHGPSALGILAGNTRGILHLHRLFHQGLGAQSLIMTEGSGDICGRWTDLHFAYRRDPSVAFTLPARKYGRVLQALHAGNDLQVRSEAQAELRSEINAMLAAGEFAIVVLQHDRPLDGLAELQRYCRIRQHLREAKAPGYPQGFRHTMGLSVSDPNLVATSFVDECGITVVYYARADLSGEIQLEGGQLGHLVTGRPTLRVDLQKGMLEYWILDREEGPGSSR